MRRYTVVALALAGVLALGACSSGGSGKAATTTAPATSATGVDQLSSSSWEVAKPTPSTSAQMVCQKEAREEIASSLGVTETRVTTPTWDVAEHLYSCTYVYPTGTITLSVKELSNEAETTAYFDSIEHKYGTTQPLIGLGQGAEILQNSDVVVRKDYKVLLVDVQDLPANFIPLMGRSDVATNIAAVIMGCWSGQ
ncbi:MAG: hypothetical protein ACLPVY_16010 [Acidimicrobiia bacterium]